MQFKKNIFIPKFLVFWKIVGERGGGGGGGLKILPKIIYIYKCDCINNENQSYFTVTTRKFLSDLNAGTSVSRNSNFLSRFSKKT